MAKQALQQVLEDTIGKYVRGLDAKSLNVAIWNGKIALNNVELNVEAVNLELDRQAKEAPNLAIPFKVVSGGFGACHVEVPWRNLTSQPVIIRLSSLSITVEPYERETQGGNENMSIAQAQKQRYSSIKSANEYREQANTVRKLAGADSDSSNQTTFASRLVRRIIENIQIEISDVHISLVGKEGSAGVVLRSLSLVTTDKDGNRTFVDRTTSSSNASNVFLHKALGLEGFGVYVDESVPEEPQPHSYILEPLSFQANLRQADGNVCIDYSKYQLTSELSTVSIEVSRNQLDVVEKVSQGISMQGNVANPLFPEYRPLARISSGNAHEWWKYAKRCISRMNGRSSWAEFFGAFKKRKSYIELYKRHAHSEMYAWIEPLSENEISVLTEIEDDRTISVNILMLWRDLADGQVDLEQSKRTENEKSKAKKRGLFSVFSSETKEDSEDAPIKLTVEDLKKLEGMSKESFTEDELSKDSRLCDASFTLQSLNIVLTSYQSRQIAALNMGAVDLGFNARADGAYAFKFDMFDLKIQDRATSDTLFPNVLRSLPYDDALETAERKGVVNVQISKSKTGDQKLQLKIAAFEAVASQPFFKELMKFAIPTATSATKQGNSMSLQSASGSVNDISSALVDAWKAKTETQASWAMDVDINAPIIMVPEDCNDSRSNILVLDLGRFHLNFGHYSPAKTVEKWFEENEADNQSGVSYENGFLSTSDFSFRVATASDWLEEGSRAKGSILGLEIIEPISVKLDFGIEQSHNAVDPPRVCCIGVIPSISFLFSPMQGKKLLPVVKAWVDFSNEMTVEARLNAEPVSSTVPEIVDDGAETQSKVEAEADKVDRDPSVQSQDDCKKDEEYLATFFFRIALQRLSTTLVLDEQNRLEAHLISVSASTVVRSNGSSSSSLQMGWFWVLDLLESDTKRKQRLLAHSKLTKDPSLFAEDEKYDMLDHLVQQGVFEEDYEGSTDLADISYQKLMSEFGKASFESRVDEVLDVRFSSLSIHWNPQGLNGIISMIDSFRSILDAAADDDTIESNRRTDIRAVPPNGSSPSYDRKQGKVEGAAERKLLIKVMVESLDICLHSPRDDLPLFVLSVSEGDIKIISATNDLSCHMSLKSMSFEDIRPKASLRQYRHMIDQGTRPSEASGGGRHFFVFDYASGFDFTRAEVAIGSPQIFLIPDAVSELVTFFRVEDQAKQDSSPSLAQLKDKYGKKKDEKNMEALCVNKEGNIEVIDETRNVRNPSLLKLEDASGNKEDADNMEAIRVNREGDIEVVDGAESSRTHKHTYTMKTQVCSIVLVDLGSESSSDGKMNAGKPTHPAETVVLQGIFDVTMTIDADPETGEMINAGVRGQAETMEIFSAYGKEMLSAMQILEPAQGALHVSLHNNADEGTEVELRAVWTTDLDFFLSMHNTAMLSAIVTSLLSSLDISQTRNADSQARELSANETERIEHLSSVLEQTHSKESNQRQSSATDEVSTTETPFQLDSNVKIKTANKIQMKITMPQFRVTVVNDLLGFDEALFRIAVTHFVAVGEVEIPVGPNAMKNMTADFNMNSSILAEYFDSSTNLWSNLLVKPWEVNLKISRSSTRRFKSPRLTSAIDLESFPCHVSLSPEFLVNLDSATRMWSVYSIATSKSLSVKSEKGDNNNENVKSSMAASAARNLLTSLPYAIENYCGRDVVFSLSHGRISRRECPNGSIQYFKFQPPQGKGHGGKRVYGQDVEFEKSVTLSIGDFEIVIPHLDSMLGSQKQLHNLPEGRVLLTFVAREGRTTVLHLTSNVTVFNDSCIPFAISVGMDGSKSIGTCTAHSGEKTNTALKATGGIATMQSNRFSVPMDLLTTFSKNWADAGQSLYLCLSPNLTSDNSQVLKGGLDIAFDRGELSKSDNKFHVCRSDVTCQSTTGGSHRMDPFVVQVLMKATLIDDSTIKVDVFLEPRAVIENLFPVDITVRSKMPHISSSAGRQSESGGDIAYELQPGNRVEVFTKGDSIAVAIKPTATLSAGSTLEWMDVEVPLKSGSRLSQPMACYFPFAGSSQRKSDFFIAEGNEGLDQLSDVMANEAPKKSDLQSKVGEVSLADPFRVFHVTTCCYGIDHTGEILFESVPGHDDWLRSIGKDRNQSYPFGAFSSEDDSSRLTMLPNSNSMLRLLQTTVGSEGGYRATLPFAMDDLVIGEGGVNALPIVWDNKKSSGYCAYRRLVNEHQSEIHIVPEFVVFNGSTESVIISERGMEDIIVEAGRFVPLKCVSRTGGLDLALDYIKGRCKTKRIRVNGLGVKMELVHSPAGTPVGSVCVQTALDTYGNARFVVKIGEITAGQKKANASSMVPAFLEDDFIRFRVRWTELYLVLKESREILRAEGSPSKDLSPRIHTDKNGPKAADPNSLMSFKISRFSFDVQRVFKEQGDGDQKVKASVIASPERCQISMIIHQLQVRDLTPDSSFPVIFDSTSDVNFIDWCARTRGPIGGDIVNVDLFDLSLAHSKGKSEMIQLTTSEEYVWRIVDLVTRMNEASRDVGNYSLVFTEDANDGGFIVEIEDGLDKSDDRVMYKPPRVDQLYDVELARVSPFALLVSFRRTPDESRYEMARNVKGAALTNYFTRKLKFSIDKAKLNFGKYENRNFKGPPDRLLESLGTVYIGRMKFKVLTLLSSASLQDWQFLAARGGDDEYVEGDELRATGNLAGMAVGALVGTVGRGLGDGVSNVTRTLGKGIEDATGLVGARQLGAGVNTVISGVGDGVGSTLTGVGGGAGKILHGAGQGVGQVVGGVLGGAFQMGKGIGEGIIKGDGKVLVDGIGKGAGQIGGGAVTGIGSVLNGAKDGVLTAGKGIFQFGKKKPDEK